MKVRIELTLDIDVEAWVINYCNEGWTPAWVRADVKEHATQSLTEHFRDLGLLTEPERTAP